MRSDKAFIPTLMASYPLLVELIEKLTTVAILTVFVFFVEKIDRMIEQ